jgi:hypothetical protein
MTLKKLIGIVDAAYPDGLVMQHHQGQDAGDTLAQFLAQEIAGTFDSKATDLEQFAEAERAVRVAIRELSAVAETLRALASV